MANKQQPRRRQKISLADHRKFAIGMTAFVAPAVGIGIGLLAYAALNVVGLLVIGTAAWISGFAIGKRVSIARARPIYAKTTDSSYEYEPSYIPE